VGGRTAARYAPDRHVAIGSHANYVLPLRTIRNASGAWVDFPGYWGELQYIHAPQPIGSIPFATSPVGPAYHDVGVDPVGTLATWTAG